MKKSTLIKLGLIGTALVLLPRRSSKKADCAINKSGKGCGCASKDNSQQQQSANSKKCPCPLCKIGKCPLCAIGKCFCCKKPADKKADKTDK